jgi:hypothetical protein
VDGGVAPERARSVHAVQLASDGEQGFVAEQSIYDGDGTTAYGTAGLAR